VLGCFDERSKIQGYYLQWTPLLEIRGMAAERSKGKSHAEAWTSKGLPSVRVKASYKFLRAKLCSLGLQNAIGQTRGSCAGTIPVLNYSNLDKQAGAQRKRYGKPNHRSGLASSIHVRALFRAGILDERLY